MPVKRTKWPKSLIVPMPRDFDHGQWVTTRSGKLVADDMVDLVDKADAGMTLSEEERSQILYSCKTQCCLVGWAALAFDEERCTSSDLRNPATAAFLNKFIELAGHRPVDPKAFPNGERDITFMETVGDRASDVFEGGTLNGDRLTPRRANALWKKTAEHFGYDVKNLVDIYDE